MPPSLREDGSEYQPRDWSPAYLEALKAHLEWVREREATHGLPNNDTWRKATLLYSLQTPCQHVARSLVEVETDHGIWGCEICVECGKQVAGPECPHVHNSWHLDGAVLICDNCGMDVT